MATYIGPQDDTLKQGEEYSIKSQRMGGKIYDGQNYKTDERVMVWVSNTYSSTLWYKVLDNESELNKYFKP